MKIVNTAVIALSALISVACLTMSGMVDLKDTYIEIFPPDPCLQYKVSGRRESEDAKRCFEKERQDYEARKAAWMAERAKAGKPAA